MFRNGGAKAAKAMRSTNKHFNHDEQAVRLLLKFMGRWLITAAICAGYIGVIKAYDSRAFLEDDDTKVYNALTAGLTIALSLNFDASLNAFAKAIKWVILAHSPFPPKVFYLILDFDNSKVNAIRLLWHGKWGLRFICSVWLLIVLGAQVGTALIGLTYGVSPLSADKGEFPAVTGDGTTSIFTNIGFQQWVGDTYLEPNNTTSSLASQRSTAFAYGIGAVGTQVIKLEPGDEFYSYLRSVTFDTESRHYLNAISNYPGWGMSSLTQWNAYAREVESYAECELLRVTNRTTFFDKTIIMFDGYNGTQVFIVPMAPLDYTIYISDTNYTCGARCTQVYAIFSDDDETDLFLCNNTIDLMYYYGRNETTHGDLSLPDTQARILSGAIGWGDLDIEGSLNGISTIGRFQGSSFPNESFWTPSVRPNGQTMSDDFIARFTAAAISVYDLYGPWGQFSNITIPGQASELDVIWEYVIMVLALIPAIQAVLALISIWVVYYYEVPVHDSSPLALATLLAPIVQDGSIGNLQSSREIARTIDDSLVYTFHEDSDDDQYRVEVKAVAAEK
ncbi:hypothetical protein F5Y10DRAFT_288112 [Nemania abortiva]|nr:hypothetical protein F5Y10DRAFT_288112 [Nemania abortiva]